jgi:hypothetical protein
MTTLLSGLIREEEGLRGANTKDIVTYSGTGVGIRFNELLVYHVSEAAKLDTGALDMSDASRKADTLMENVLNQFFGSGVSRPDLLSSVGLASNSDVETFVPSAEIIYGEVQDFINTVEDQSGGEIVIDMNDVINLRNEIRGPVGGRGFTVKNQPSRISLVSDDADDTMYLRGKSWSYSKTFYKDEAYSNQVMGILPAEGQGGPNPSIKNDFGLPASFIQNATGTSRSQDWEFAAKFRPRHTHWLLGDIFVAVNAHQLPFDKLQVDSDTIDNIYDNTERVLMNQMRQSLNTMGLDRGFPIRYRIAGPDTANTPNNLPVVASFDFSPKGLDWIGSGSGSKVSIINETLDTSYAEWQLDTTRDYWLILTSEFTQQGIDGDWIQWSGRTGSSGTSAYATAFKSSASSAGSGWTVGTGTQFWFDMPLTRSHAFSIYDPKAMRNTVSGPGLPAGLPISSLLPDAGTAVKTREAMIRYLSNNLYQMCRPRIQFNMSRVTAPNIPPVPGDTVIPVDSVRGFSTPGNQIVQTLQGDMRYNWDFNTYQAPTILNLNPVGIATGYK